MEDIECGVGLQPFEDIPCLLCWVKALGGGGGKARSGVCGVGVCGCVVCMCVGGLCGVWVCGVWGMCVGGGVCGMM